MDNVENLKKSLVIECIRIALEIGGFIVLFLTLSQLIEQNKLSARPVIISNNDTSTSTAGILNAGSGTALNVVAFQSVKGTFTDPEFRSLDTVLYSVGPGSIFLNKDFGSIIPSPISKEKFERNTVSESELFDHVVTLETTTIRIFRYSDVLNNCYITIVPEHGFAKVKELKAWKCKEQ